MPLNDVYSGADGTLVLIAAGTDAESADATAITSLEAFSIADVGRVTGVELHVDTDLREFHEVGRRHATSLHPGNIHIWGTIDRAYVNGALLVGLALFFPSLGPGSIQSDIIVPGLLLVLSTIPTRRLLPMVRAPHPDGARNSASG